MRIAVAFKAVPDAQDVQVAGDRTLDFSKAKLTISEYDKNALELGAQLADEAVAITVGGSLAGVAGMLFSVPVVLIFRSIARNWPIRYESI